MLASDLGLFLVFGAAFLVAYFIPAPNFRSGFAGSYRRWNCQDTVPASTRCGKTQRSPEGTAETRVFCIRAPLQSCRKGLKKRWASAPAYSLSNKTTEFFCSQFSGARRPVSGIME